ncbi:hypothetical protein [Spiroplasma endosymbiont of Lariophagus distinguendus]|uniref:hypothetical protein n=1 Tax=Spiroplasma endosymbiont of Lariophagus distinguendus TaxID=2935082 RepID=UPI00207AB817|nr:hypothetical protein [Spiroplasma endosymbiont of Lariophagus distinguendus]
MFLLASISKILAIKLAIMGALFLIFTLIPGVLLFCHSVYENKKINFKEKKTIIGTIFLILSILSFIEVIIFTTIT